MHNSYIYYFYLLLLAEGYITEIAFIKIAPRKSSPTTIDADGVKAYDLGVTLSGHTSWWKIYDPDTAIIGDLPNGQQKIFSFAGFKVEEDEFGRVTYDYTEGWGV